MSKKTEVTEDKIPAGGEVLPPEAIPMEDRQRAIAKRIAIMLSPIIAKELAEKRVAFVGLSVIVDNNYSVTFPFHAVEHEEMTQEERSEIRETEAKAIMLASFEYARTAGNLKRKAINALDKCLEK